MAGEAPGPITALWAAVFALSNVYIAAFLATAYLNAHPEKLLAIRNLLRRLRGISVGADDEGGGGASGKPGAASSSAAGAALRNGHCAAPAAGLDTTSTIATDSDGGDEAAPAAPPVELEWRALSLSVPGVSGRRQILQGIYGSALPGELQALMGPSGAGKSTLLDVLAMRVRSGRAASVGGEVLVNGGPRRARQFLAASAYVPQHDNFVPTMTAEETAAFYAAVVLPPETHAAARAERVGAVLRLMGLAAQRHTLVGGTLPGGLMLRGLSGGERRRLAIACGVVAGPGLVFLDEPTSGLDSFAALSVSRFMRRMADSGHTLLAAIHQPRAAIWSLFDKVTLLSQGRLMYHGAARGMVPWFVGLGYAFDAKQHGSAPDWALDLVTLGFTKGPRTWDDDGGGDDDGGELAGGAEGAAGPGVGDAAGASSGAAGLGSVVNGVASNGAINGVSDGAINGVGNGAGTKVHWEVEAAAASGSGGGGGGAATMRSGAELRVAADAMRRRLALQHPEWFAGGAAGAGAGAAASSGALAASSSQRSLHVPQHAEPRGAAAGPELPGLLARAGRGAWRQWVHFRALLWREMVTLVRNPADVAGRMATFCYVGLLNGLMHYSLSGQASSIQDRVGACYGYLSFFMLMPFVFMGLFWSDRTFYLADAPARLYHPAAYYVAKVAAALPFNAAVALSFHLIYYGMAGLRHGPVHVVRSAVVSVLMALNATQTVYLCATVAPSQDIAFMYAIAYTALNLLACGYLQRFEAYGLPGLAWLRYVSAMDWAWEASILVELGGRQLPCDAPGDPGLSALGVFTDLIPDYRTLGLIGSSLRSGLGPGCVAEGDVILRYYGVRFTYGQMVGILCAFLAGTTALTYWALYRGARKAGGK